MYFQNDSLNLYNNEETLLKTIKHTYFLILNNNYNYAFKGFFHRNDYPC